jgi:hypothetical protein
MLPIFATVNIVTDFATQFVKMEAENAQLRAELATDKSSAEQIETTNKLAAEAWRRAEDLEKELSQVKVKLEEAQKLKEETESLVEKREDRLRKSVESLLGKLLRHFTSISFPLSLYALFLVFIFCSGIADTPFDRSNKLQVDSITDFISFDVDSGEKVQELLKKTKAALSKLYALVFPNLGQDKSFGELAEAFFIDNNGLIEVRKCTSRLYGVLLAFPFMMGYGVEAKFEELSKALPIEEDVTAVHLSAFKKSARTFARQLIELVEANKNKGAAKTAPSASGQKSDVVNLSTRVLIDIYK